MKLLAFRPATLLKDSNTAGTVISRKQVIYNSLILITHC